MGRPDGKRVKNLPYFDSLIPHIMNKRIDATNYTQDEFDITELTAYLHTLRKQGNHIGIMDFLLATIAQTVLQYSVLNRFVVNKKIYHRNYFCISFVVIKRVDKTDIKETVVKIYFKPGDDLYSIAQKVQDAVNVNEKEETKNTMDRFVDKIMSLPVIPGFLISTLKLMDRYGLMPRKVIDLSPFHTTMFVSNMASINMNPVYHHLYEFGTTSIFMTMGKPKKVIGEDGKTRRILPLSFSIDERICAGAGFVRCLSDMKKYVEKPHKLQEAMLGKIDNVEKISV